MHLPRIAAVVLCGATAFSLAPSLHAADERLQRVIDNVRANEPLYQNIEAHITFSYEVKDPDELKLFGPPRLLVQFRTALR